MKADSTVKADEQGLAEKSISPVAPCLQCYYSDIKIQQGKILKQNEAVIAKRQRDEKKRRFTKKSWSGRALKTEQLLLRAPCVSREVLPIAAPTVIKGVPLHLGSWDLPVHSISQGTSSTQTVKLGSKVTESVKS